MVASCRMRWRRSWRSFNCSTSRTRTRSDGRSRLGCWLAFPLLRPYRLDRAQDLRLDRTWRSRGGVQGFFQGSLDLHWHGNLPFGQHELVRAARVRVWLGGDPNGSPACVVFASRCAVVLSQSEDLQASTHQIVYDHLGYLDGAIRHKPGLHLCTGGDVVPGRLVLGGDLGCIRRPGTRRWRRASCPGRGLRSGYVKYQWRPNAPRRGGQVIRGQAHA